MAPQAVFASENPEYEPFLLRRLQDEASEDVRGRVMEKWSLAKLETEHGKRLKFAAVELASASASGAEQ